MDSIYYDTKIAVEALKYADNETLTGVGVDMAGYDAVAFIVGALKGEVGSFTIKAQQDSASNFGTAADLEGTSTTFATAVGTDGVAVLDINNPQERYVRPIIAVPNLNAVGTPTFCISIRYKAHKTPQTNTGEYHVAPAEGTA